MLDIRAHSRRVLKTAISPMVPWSPGWTPDTSSIVSGRLNWENCVYFHRWTFMSASFHSSTGKHDFHTCTTAKSPVIFITYLLLLIQLKIWFIDRSVGAHFFLAHPVYYCLRQGGNVFASVHPSVNKIKQNIFKTVSWNLTDYCYRKNPLNFAVDPSQYGLSIT